MDRSLGLRLQPEPSRWTLPCLLGDAAARHAERVAFHFEGRELRYRELEREARCLARGLIGAGVVKGARVALLFANRPEWATAAFAVSMAGGVGVPVSTFATPSERDYILRHSDASLLLLQRSLLKRDFLGELLEAYPELTRGAPGRLRCPALPCLRRVFCLGTEEVGGGVETWEELRALGDDVPEALLDAAAAEVAPSDDALIIYTSGTTAHPKGILHAQRAPAAQSYRFAEYMDLTPEDRVWTAQPFFWTAGIAMSLGATLAAGARLILQETFDAGRALDVIEAERVTLIHAWPHQEKALAEHPSAASRDLSSARRVNFGSPLASLVGLERDEWGIQAAYGLSETFTVASLLPATAPADMRRGTHGRAPPGTELRIVDPETGEPLEGDSQGEIAVRGATLMRGYYKLEPELYLDAAGFFHTQDGGWIDKDGYLHWTGRLSNLIKTGGANVSPLEIESALGAYPGLKAGLAVGVPHPTLGEAIVLCAIPTGGTKLDPEEMRRFLRSKLAAYKVPRCVLVFGEDEIAYTGNQKIQTGPLREAALRRLEELGVEIEGARYGGER